MALTRREQAEYDRLREKRRAQSARDSGGRSRSRRRRDEEEDDDGDHIMVFSGRQAGTFLDRMFGPSSSDDDDEDDDEDEDPDDDDPDDDDPEPPAGHGFFRGRRR